MEGKRIFYPDVTLEFVATSAAGTMLEHIGIEFLELGDNYLVARMPVDHRTRQPLGLLHGGASLALAETLGSMGAYCCVDRDHQDVVGVEINANHLKAMRSGFVYGTSSPVHMGRTTQVWETKIRDEAGGLVCVSRMTLAVIAKRDPDRKEGTSRP